MCPEVLTQPLTWFEPVLKQRIDLIWRQVFQEMLVDLLLSTFCILGCAKIVWFVTPNHLSSLAVIKSVSITEAADLNPSVTRVLDHEPKINPKQHMEWHTLHNDAIVTLFAIV